ncbi:MAG TPA: nitrite/sulfite reductase [Anaerolineae bacterium]|nr:nitrite/sulfite reductase [Anaerolineae bacterium]
MADELAWDLVLKRNSIERLKKEKHPLHIVQELPQLIERGYEEISEEDVVRLQWYGLYHDKPKIGYFMMRIKIANGILAPNQLRTIGKISTNYGRSYGELSTRQNIQLHWIRLEHLPAIFQTLARNGLTTVGGCGDNVRNITGCPVTGISDEELFDARPIVEAAAKFFYGNPDYSDLPRKHKITIAACPHQCNAPDIHCIALLGAIYNGREGFAVRIGGGLSTVPRIARDMNVFVEKENAIEVLRAIIDVWQASLKYRMSRVKARLKFMVDDIGAEKYRELVEAELGRTLESYPAPAPTSESDHLGIHSQKQEGLNYIGFPVHLGWMQGEQMMAIADLVESFGGDIRLTRQQNFVVTGVPTNRVDEIVGAVEAIGFSLKVNRLRGSSIACTGSPLCNYAVSLTKPQLGDIIEHLENTFGKDAEGIKINLDGCPHACTHHWVGDIGLQGTTLRERGTSGEKLEGYDIYLRGGLGRDAAIGQPLIRRVHFNQVHLYVERLVRAYLNERQEGERFKMFCDRRTDAELISIASDRPLEQVIAETQKRVERREKSDD